MGGTLEVLCSDMAAAVLSRASACFPYCLAASARKREKVLWRCVPTLEAAAWNSLGEILLVGPG